jgi:hypothetical protein
MSNAQDTPEIRAQRGVFYLILWYNVPVAALFLMFDLWRVAVTQDGSAACSIYDLVCSLTQQYGDRIPIVSSFTLEAGGQPSSVHVKLVRELLFFNVMFWLFLGPVGVAAFAYRAFRFGLYKLPKIQKQGRMKPLLGGAFMFSLFVLQNLGPFFSSRDWIFTHWTGIFRFNVCSLLSFITLMIIVVYLRQWYANAREARAIGNIKEFR